MSVIGIDLGNDSCYIAVNRQGGIETIDNDYSLRATPSIVAFGERHRLVGVAAKNQLLTNLGNTLYNFKRYLGKKCDDPLMLEDLFPFAVVPVSNEESVGMNVMYLGEKRKFSPVELTAMLLTKLKLTAEAAIQGSVQDCVISVPSFFTDVERRCLLDAAKIANLNVLRLFNDTTAAALCYGFYKDDLPGQDEKPRNVVIVDCGHSSTQASVCAFNSGEVKILATAFDTSMGGRNFDQALAAHFGREIQAKYRIDLLFEERASKRLLAEVERLKKQMSANTTKLPLYIENLFDEIDYNSSISREEFERMSQGLFQRFENVLEKALDDSKLDLNEIHSVEIVGGSTRIPALKQLIEKIFQMGPSTTLNQDEAVSRGCALMCAILSPALKVRDFKITDVQPFPIKLVWDESRGDDGFSDVFPRYHPVPFTKMITIHAKESLTLKAIYGEEVPFPSREMGKYVVHFPNEGQESSKIRIKAKLNMSGIFSVCGATASVQEKTGSTQNVSAEAEMPAESVGTSLSQPGSCGDENDPIANVDIAKLEVEFKNLPFHSLELAVDSATGSLSLNDLDDKIVAEIQMITQDEQERGRLDSKNTLEEFIYQLRQGLEKLTGVIDENEKSLLLATLISLEEWLYEDGMNESKDVYLSRLEELRTLFEPYQQ